MKLVFLYGPPASGKLTVAKELAKLTGYKLFHNHLTADLVAPLFPFGTKEYSELVHKIRLLFFEAAAKSRIAGMIFTFVYAIETFGGKSDDEFVRKVMSAVEKRKGRVFLVKLTCSRKELFKRLKAESRNAHGKLKSPKVLREIMSNNRLDEVVPFGKTLVIDNTKLSPRKTAEKIIKHYRL